MPTRSSPARTVTAEDASRSADRGARQGPAEGDLQDGHLDDPLLPRRPDLRGGRPRRGLVDRHFTGTPSRVGGIGLAEIAREALDRHARAYPEPTAWRCRPSRRRLLPAAHETLLPQGGVYRWRRDGERHMWDPETDRRACSAPCATRRRARTPTTSSAAASTRRTAAAACCAACCASTQAGEPIPLDEVEPAAEIVKRFATGAMSLGSLSPEAHETLADRDEPPRRQVEHAARAARTAAATARPERRPAPLGDPARWRRPASA